MAAVQEHGLVIERILGEAHLGGGMPEVPRTSVFDIPAESSRDGVPVSLKAAKATRSGATIGLGDARRIWASVSGTRFRILCATYHQDGAEKVFTRVHEALITPAAAPSLLGLLTMEDVSALHVELLGFGAGQHAAARRHAKSRQAALLRKRGLVRLNPKIDSKSQRRLQCSVRLSDLLALPEIESRVHDAEFHGVTLPLRILSAARSFGDRA